jgi:hypothetical protein
MLRNYREGFNRQDAKSAKAMNAKNRRLRRWNSRMARTATPSVICVIGGCFPILCAIGGFALSRSVVIRA